MEELLNKLIGMGWNPYGDGIHRSKYKRVLITKTINSHIELFFESNNHIHRKTLRSLVSKESGLWQFVCENKFVKTKDKKVRYRYEDLERTQNYFSRYGYEYRLIESALCDEDKLEDFILKNIQLGK